ncbi:protein FAM221B [Lepus europaeus]|uniref:protein FAM221B n=1 Tax=Lepus europaeus TaxID=9983 RepID=UPI002B484BDA|nr:protein FAM221B [Lepus europaeus]
MEADEAAEEIHTTKDAEPHPSSEDPPVEDLQEPPLEPSIPEAALEPQASQDIFVPSPAQMPSEPYLPASPLMPSPPQTPLGSPISESPSVPSPPQTLLEPHASDSPLEPAISHISLQQAISEAPLKPPTSETLLETPIYKVPDKHLSFQPSSVSPVSGSSSEVLKEGPLSEPSSSEIPRTRRATQVPEVEHLPKHSLPGPSAHFYTVTYAKQKDDAEEDEEGEETSGTTAHTALPGHQMGKKKAKKEVICHPVDPATQAESVEAAKTMHREQFGTRVNYVFQWEKNAALKAIQSGLYVGWRCPHYLWDCFRIRDESKCFCGHLLREHHVISDISVPCRVSQCRCLMFCFIPSRPEEVGEFWLKRRATFDPKAWRAQCRCKHSHEDHAATGSHPCRHPGCCCNCFESNFLCAACDRRWEEHETFFETEETRRRGGRPHGTHTVSNWRRPM